MIENPLSDRAVFKLYLRGHRAELVGTLCAFATAVSVLAGSVPIPLPWAVSSDGLAVSLNCFLALLIVVALITAMTTPLAKLEEEISRASWLRPDLLTVACILLGPLLLAPLGNPGLLQYTLISLSGAFFASLFLGPQVASSAVILATVSQIILVLLIDDRWLPVFWDPSPVIILVAAVLAATGFVIARTSLKRGETIQLVSPTV